MPNFVVVSPHCPLKLGFTKFWHPIAAALGPELKNIELFYQKPTTWKCVRVRIAAFQRKWSGNCSTFDRRTCTVLYSFIFRNFWVRELSKMQLTARLNVVTAHLSFSTHLFGWRHSPFLILSKPRCHTVSLTPWSTVLLEKLTGSQLVQKLSAVYGTRKSIIAFTSVRHLCLSWARSIQSMPPHPTSWRSILILSSHLCLGLPSGFFPSGFPTKTLCTIL
jgi:hypothetical protein